MIKIVSSVIVNILLCLIYYWLVEIFNLYKPIIHWNISFGITFQFGVIILFITLFIEMLIFFFIKNKLVRWIPLILPLLYCLTYYHIFPYRLIVYIFLNITIYLLYSMYLTRLKK